MSSPRKYTAASSSVQSSHLQENFLSSLPVNELPTPRETGVFPLLNLKVDFSYQHPEYLNAVDALAKDFRFERSGFILVSIRSDNPEIGWILDGQTRRAVCEKKGIPYLHAEIMRGLTVQEEAEVYITRCVLTKRKPIDRFHAEHVAGHQDAITLYGLLYARGLFVMSHEARTSHVSSLNEITCVYSLKQLLRYDTDGFYLGGALDLIRATWPDDERALTRHVIEATFDLIREHDEDIDRKSFAAKLGENEIKELYHAATALRLASTPNLSLRKAMKNKMIELYNIHRQEKRRIRVGA